MTETTERPAIETPASPRGRRGGEGLSGLVLADLKAMAGQLGIKGTSAMRKGDLVAAISARQNGGSHTETTPHIDRAPAEPTPAAAPPAGNGHAKVSESTQTPTLPLELPAERVTREPESPAPSVDSPTTAPADDADGGTDGGTSAERSENGFDSNRNRRNRRNRRGDTRTRPDGRTDEGGEAAVDSPAVESGESSEGQPRRDNRNQDGGNRNQDGGAQRTQDGGGRPQQDNRQQDSRQQDSRQQDSGRNDGRSGARNDNRNDSRNDNRSDSRSDSRDDPDDDGPGGRRGRRFRDRNRRTRDRFADAPDTEVRDDDVLVAVAGIVDVLDSYAFIRTSGYLSGPNDVYVSLSQVRKYGLRRGDAVTGAVRGPRDGEAARQKFNALVRLDSVNGLDPEQARNRPEFTKLTPLYPNERLRLETEAHLLTTRVIDLVMPVGKGQRALIVSPPKAGKTMVMQAIANAITTNNPECHLMVVLVDERPEEVTDMQRSVRGEVIASTFDRPPADHTMVAELSIERAKRLVEMGRDVVVLLDSITRLGRAYNLAAPASGRILSGGVDSTALFPPKRFLGAARNIENGGSLTIFASALVETGSAGDTVIFEEFKGTGNAELKLDRKLADKRIFPAIDVDQSSTRKEDLLLAPDELAIVVKLRRLLGALDTQQALELVLDRLRKTRSNVEFLMQVAKNTPGAERD